MARLGDICTIYTGTGFPNQYQGETSGDYPFYKVGDISKNVTKGNKYLQECDNYVSADIVKKIKGTIVPIDTVVFAKIGEAVKLNKRAITSKNCLVDNNAMGVCPDQKRLNLSYFFHYMCNIQLETYAEATTVPSVKKSIIENLDIPLPTYEEQTKKSLILDKVCDLISLRKQQLSKLDELVKSRFIEMFGDPMENPMGWDRVNISAVVGGKVSNGFFAKRDDYCDDGNVKVLGVAHVVNRMYSNVEDLPITNGTEADVAKYGVKYGDMLFCRSSLVAAGIGKASIVPKDTPNNVLFECHVIRLPLALNKCVPEFMQVLSTTDYFRNQVIAQSKTATMTTIGQDGILKTDIILPPLELQKQFLKFVEQTDKSKFEIQKSLEKLETLKKALMQKYFG